MSDFRLVINNNRVENTPRPRLGSVAGPVIQATGRSEFEDSLGSGDFVLGLGDFVLGFSYHRVA
jgi:hypothetical protein